VTSATFPGAVPSIADARRFVAANVAGLAGEVLDDIALMVSELATNVVRHAGTTFRVTVEQTTSRVTVAVTDRAGGEPRRRDPAPHEASGRGLLIVDRLADAWGVDAAPPGKTVWFAVTLSAQPAGGA
jgi:anti-sigma regulatory factor (Ser/Thr protein kinase)